MKTTFSAMLEACGLKTAEVAEMFGVTRDAVKKWTAGINNPPAEVLDALGELFEQIERLADVILDAVEAVEEEGGMELLVELPGQLPGNAELMALARAQLVLGQTFRLIPAERSEAAEKARLLRLPPAGSA